jgi:hypothetical protein
MRCLLFIFLLCFLAPAFASIPMPRTLVGEFAIPKTNSSQHILRTALGIIVDTSLTKIIDSSRVLSKTNRKPLVKMLSVDSSRILVKKFNAQVLKQLAKQSEFKYDQTVPLTDGLWGRFWKAFWRLIFRIFNNGNSGNVIKYILLAALTGLVIYAILKIGGLEFNIFTGKSKTLEVPYNESIENIHAINFEEEIQKATEAANYRLAVRLLYLRALKALNDQNLIQWQPEKTNQAYVNEITDADKKDQFAFLTREFEYIWYGDFAIEKAGFNEVRESFIQFNLQKS